MSACEVMLEGDTLLALPGRTASLGADGVVEEQWLVINALGGAEAKALAVKSKQGGRGLISWVGVAAQIAKKQPGMDTEAVPPLEGQAYTFLPLPVQTGLPVHVSCLYYQIAEILVPKAEKVALKQAGLQ